ncbi:MAG: tyrosine-type recombinase/integrase [Acidimicrobiales bacterium]
MPRSPRGCGHGLHLADELGAPCHPETLSGWFEAAVEKAKLPRIRLHDTRHTAASLMLAQGVPVKVVSEMFGHSSPTNHTSNSRAAGI